MAQDTQVNPIGFSAGQDFVSADLYKAVKYVSGAVVLADVNDLAVGVLVNLGVNGKTGTQVAVAIFGTTKVLAGGSISDGDRLISGVGGAVVKATLTTGVKSIGFAMADASTSDIIEMFIEKLIY